MRKLLLLILLCPLLQWGELQAQCAIFYDGFESGTYTPTWNVGVDLSPTVTTTNPYSGIYRLEGTGGSSTHLTGLNTSFAASTPSTISWDIQPQGGATTNYFVAGNASVSATNCIVFAYWQGSTNTIRFVSSVTHVFNGSIGTWYHIELRNINWSAHTFDLYVNNVLQYTSFPFRSSTQNDVSRVHLYNFTNGTGVWDNIRIGGAAPFVMSNVVTQPSCIGDTDGSIDFSITGGTPGYIYNWSTGATTQDITGLAAGTYSISVLDAGGCEDSLNITVADPDPFVFGDTIIDASCFGTPDGSIDLSPTGGTGAYTYNWSNSTTNQDLNNVAGGTYTLTITDANSCEGIDSFTVGQPAQILVGNTIVEPLCAGGNNGSATAIPSGGAGGGFTYLWSNSSTSATISNLTAGNYQITVTDSTGCSTTETIQVTEPTALNVIGIPDPNDCFGGSNAGIDLNVSGGTPGYLYAWNTGASSQDLSGLLSGIYAVTVTDTNGCLFSATYTLNDPAPLAGSSTITNETNLGLGGIDLTVTGGTPAYGYIWNTGATTQDLTNLSAGNYSVTVTDANGCTSVFNFFVDFVIGIEDWASGQITAFPNPFRKDFTITMEDVGTAPIQLTLTDLQGRSLWQRTALNETRIDVNLDLPSGVYFLHLTQEGRSKTIKLHRE